MKFIVQFNIPKKVVDEIVDELGSDFDRKAQKVKDVNFFYRRLFMEYFNPIHFEYEISYKIEKPHPHPLRGNGNSFVPFPPIQNENIIFHIIACEFNVDLKILEQNANDFEFVSNVRPVFIRTDHNLRMWNKMEDTEKIRVAAGPSIDY